MKTVSARLTLRDGSAQAAEDFEAASQILTFAPGQVEQTFSLNLIDDEIFELEETLTLNLTEPKEVRLPQPQVGLTIFDNDPLPLLTLNLCPLPKGNRHGNFKPKCA